MSGIDDLNRTLANLQRGMQPDFSNVQESINQMSMEREARTAKGFYDRIAVIIKRFEASLDDEHEVGVKLASFGQAVTFSISEMGYIDPLLIVFHGHTENEDPIELIQHVNQISFVLIRIKRKELQKPKNPIGFMH